jgi:RNA polymerase sigma-70 factor (sigma-E family)
VRPTGVSVDFEDFVVARGPALVRFAHALSGDRHLAEDFVQEVLVKAHRRWARIDSPESYLRSAVCRELLSWRRRRSSGERPGVVPDRPATGPPEAGESLDAVWQALAALSPRQRAVVVLRYWEDFADRDIAALLSCSEGTVRSSATRAFAALRTVPPFTDLRPEETVR